VDDVLQLIAKRNNILMLLYGITSAGVGKHVQYCEIVTQKNNQKYAIWKPKNIIFLFMDQIVIL